MELQPSCLPRFLGGERWFKGDMNLSSFENKFEKCLATNCDLDTWVLDDELEDDETVDVSMNSTFISLRVSMGESWRILSKPFSPI